VGIFVAGMLGTIFPKDYLRRYLGENTVFANLAAVLFGVFMYFPTLVEVPMAKFSDFSGSPYGKDVFRIRHV